MKLKKHIILFCLLLVIEIPFNNLISQNIQTKPTRQSSFEAFSQGNYEKAFSEFKELLLTYPKDPLYKYYSGVSLIKLNRDPVEATNLLQEALQGSGSVKALPSDGLFYLGRAQQMSAKYSEAASSYNLYTDRVGKKAAKEMGVPELIQQCLDKKGKVENSKPAPLSVANNNKADSAKMVVTTEVTPPVKQPVQYPVDKTAENKRILPGEYEKLLNEAVEFQFKADSVGTIVGEQKKSLEKLTGDEKSALKVRISEYENIAASFQMKAEQKNNMAQALLHPAQDSAMQLKNQNVQPDIKADKVIVPKNEAEVTKLADKQPDTSGEAMPPITSRVEVYSFFEVSIKPVTDPNIKIVIDPEIPAGLIYRIQIAVFRNPVAPAYFKGISPVYGFKIEGTDKINYCAGMFRKLSDASKALGAVKRKGFKDAFIVALSDNKRVSSDRAVVMEKEWGGKPFYSIEKIIPVTKADTITPTLTFRVEVSRSSIPLTEDVVDGIRKIAGTRGLDIQQLEDGKIDYLVGKFITFETAAAYADLLKKNGYREAQVVSWLGKKKIPIETAKKLFDNLK